MKKKNGRGDIQYSICDNNRNVHREVKGQLTMNRDKERKWERKEEEIFGGLGYQGEGKRGTWDESVEGLGNDKEKGKK